MTRRIATLAIVAIVLGGVFRTTSAQNTRLSFDEILIGLRTKGKTPETRTLAARRVYISEYIRWHGITFVLTPSLETLLRNAGATDDLIDAIRDVNRRSAVLADPFSRRTHGKIGINVLGCRRFDQRVTCSVLVANDGDERDLRISGACKVPTNIIDASGKIYRLVQLDTVDQKDVIAFRIPAGGGRVVTLNFDGLPVAPLQLEICGGFINDKSCGSETIAGIPLEASRANTGFFPLPPSGPPVPEVAAPIVESPADIARRDLAAGLSFYNTGNAVASFDALLKALAGSETATFSIFHRLDFLWDDDMYSGEIVMTRSGLEFRSSAATTLLEQPLSFATPKGVVPNDRPFKAAFNKITRINLPEKYPGRLTLDILRPTGDGKERTQSYDFYPSFARLNKVQKWSGIRSIIDCSFCASQTRILADLLTHFSGVRQGNPPAKKKK